MAHQRNTPIHQPLRFRNRTLSACQKPLSHASRNPIFLSKVANIMISVPRHEFACVWILDEWNYTELILLGLASLAQQSLWDLSISLYVDNSPSFLYSSIEWMNTPTIYVSILMLRTFELFAAWSYYEQNNHVRNILYSFWVYICAHFYWVNT